MGHLLLLESVKIKITTNNYEEPVSKSLLTRNTPTALLTHPFPSASLCLASSSQESWQLQRRPTASASRCRSVPVLPSHAATPPAPPPPPARPYGYRLGAASGRLRGVSQLQGTDPRRSDLVLQSEQLGGNKDGGSKGPEEEAEAMVLHSLLGHLPFPLGNPTCSTMWHCPQPSPRPSLEKISRYRKSLACRLRSSL